MKKQDYDINYKALIAAFEKAKLTLKRTFVLANNQYKIGDIIKSDFERIKINKIKIGVMLNSEYPECIYCGPLVKKDGDPIKSGEEGSIYQSNVINVNKKIKL